MNCTRFERLLPGYLDGYSDGHTIAGMESHAGACPECGRLLAAHRLILTGFSSIKPVQAPSGFEERLHAALATAEPARSPSQYAFAFQVAAMIAVVCGIAGTIMYTVADDILSKIGGSFDAVLSWFRTETQPMGIPDGIQSAGARAMDYLNQAGTVYAALFVPVDIPSTSLSIAPIYLIGALIMAIQLIWYLTFAETVIIAGARRK